LPAEFGELVEFREVSVEHKLGYFGDDRFVLFGYAPEGGEVVWKDGRSYGFGTGGWQTFLEEIAPLAARHGADLGTLTAAGTHVLVMDRERGTLCTAPREAAEAFMACVYPGWRRLRRHRQRRRARPCLCAPPGPAAGVREPRDRR
jgi:hypothetical protein